MRFTIVIYGRKDSGLYNDCVVNYASSSVALPLNFAKDAILEA